MITFSFFFIFLFLFSESFADSCNPQNLKIDLLTEFYTCKTDQRVDYLKNYSSIREWNEDSVCNLCLEKIRPKKINKISIKNENQLKKKDEVKESNTEVVRKAFKNTGSSSSSSSSSSASIAGYVTAPEIFAEYEANEIAADSKYKGKYWSISGTVDSIGKDIIDNMYVTLVVGEFVFGNVQAFFDDSEVGVLVSIQKGANVEIVCKVDGKLGNVLCRDSKLAQ